jgi:hypothetical protein
LPHGGIWRKIKFHHRTPRQLSGHGKHLHRYSLAGQTHETINSWPRFVSRLATSGINP